MYYDKPKYSKPVYNTRFPWEDHDPQGGTSLEYSYRSLDPRDVRGEDVTFYLTGATLGNTPERSMLFSTGLTTGNGAPGTLNRSGKSG
ncbi:hypothetical protein EG830_10320 [bacterium]|nr:hypothetical protein [bacterium]